MIERFCISSHITLAHLEILLQRGKEKRKVNKEHRRLCLTAFSRWIHDELMGKYSRRRNEKVNKQNKKLEYDLAERRTKKQEDKTDQKIDKRTKQKKQMVVRW